MTSIDRRQFASRMTLAAGAVAVPAWLARAFGIQDPGPARQDPKRESDRADQLRAARRRAVARGKPLLVFVVPQDNSQRYTRGRRFGALLNHGGSDVLLDLALCELACATTDEVRKALGTARIEGEPLMLVIDPAGAAAPIAIDAKLDAARDWVGAGDYQTWLAREEAYVRDCTRKIAAALRARLARDRAQLVERADQARGTLAADERTALERFFGGGEPPADDLLVRAAAVVRMAAEAPRREGDRERVLGALEAAAKAAFVDHRIAGSKWATSQGCGVTIEGERGLGLGCGMGYVPKLCERFLYFFAG